MGIRGLARLIYFNISDQFGRIEKNKALRSYSSESTDTALEQFKDFEGTWTGIWLDPIVLLLIKNLRPDILC